MTSEEKVKAKYPEARAVRYTTNGGGSYWLVWSDRTTGAARLSDGKTKSNAFVNAAAKLDR